VILGKKSGGVAKLKRKLAIYVTENGGCAGKFSKQIFSIIENLYRVY
jgi:hypothetical protein